MDAIAQLAPLDVLTERIDVPEALGVNDLKGKGVTITRQQTHFAFSSSNLLAGSKFIVLDQARGAAAFSENRLASRM